MCHVSRVIRWKGFQMQMLVHVNETALLPLHYSTHKRNPHEEGRIQSSSVHSPSWPPHLFSEKCLIALIHSNSIGLPVFSGQTFHTKGADSLCTFHLFLMAGPSDTGPGASLPCALLSVIALSSSEGSHEGEAENLKVEATVPLSTFLCTEHPAVSSEANRDPKRLS